MKWGTVIQKTNWRPCNKWATWEAAINYILHTAEAEVNFAEVLDNIKPKGVISGSVGLHLSMQILWPNVRGDGNQEQRLVSEFTALSSFQQMALSSKGMFHASTNQISTTTSEIWGLYICTLYSKAGLCMHNPFWLNWIIESLPLFNQLIIWMFSVSQTNCSFVHSLIHSFTHSFINSPWVLSSIRCHTRELETQGKIRLDPAHKEPTARKVRHSHKSLQNSETQYCESNIQFYIRRMEKKRIEEDFLHNNISQMGVESWIVVTIQRWRGRRGTEIPEMGTRAIQEPLTWSPCFHSGLTMVYGQIPSLPDLRLPIASCHTWNKNPKFSPSSKGLIGQTLAILVTILLFTVPMAQHFSHTGLSDILQTFQASSYLRAFAKCLPWPSYIN